MATIDRKKPTVPNKGPLVVAVDDDSVSLRVIKSTLEKNRYIVKTASRGEEELLVLRDVVPDILILDVMMPGMSGYDLCHITKRDERLQIVPVIFLTGDASPADLKTVPEAGAVFYLTKPIRPDRLLQVVRMLQPSPVG